MTDVMAATKAYEAWIRSQAPIIPADLAEKHRRMAATPFGFMRGAFYRWVPTWTEICADLASAPTVLGVGDLHVENFGTWRDGEGRLVWGINDLDEAAEMPYTLDLVRLATSALLVRRGGDLTLSANAICAAIAEGYGDHLACGGRAFVLEERHRALRTMALSADREPGPFWDKLTALSPVRGPGPIRRLLAKHLPGSGADFHLARRVAGVGSLGRPRFVGLVTWAGGLVAREAKLLLPSAYSWALGRPSAAIRSGALLKGAVRCADPTYGFDTAGGKTWVVRRLAPHCSRIELSELPRRHDETALLRAMGAETANLHLASAKAVPRVRRDLARRPTRWLVNAATAMAAATTTDWRVFAAHFG